MTTEYEFAVLLVFWGDKLDWQQLANDLQLSVRRHRTMNEPLTRPDGTESGSVAKTGMLTCECSARASDLRRDPEAQLLVAVEALRRLTKPLGATYGVDESELQMNVYYDEKVSGEPDFMFPLELIDLLALHRMKLGVTVLP